MYNEEVKYKFMLMNKVINKIKILKLPMFKTKL